MDFAKKQLEKYGWSEGKGLGKKEDGISEPLKAKLKFDNGGIGHDVGAQFTNNWWERVFNNAATNMNVKVEENEVKFELHDEPVEISTKNYSIRDLKKKNNNFEYGTFLKTARFTSNGTEVFDVDVPEPVVTFTSLTDDELFAACGGRTAHKGARHGLKLSGKLSRIEKQERILLKKMKNVSLVDEATNVEKKMKKLKKHKEDVIIDSSQEMEMPSPSTSKKKKNKRKSVTFNDATVVKYYTPEADTSNESVREDNPAVDVNANNCDEGIEQDIEDSLGEVGDSHKSFEESQRTFSDLSKAERKKLKKKRKLDKKNTATGRFLEEVELSEESSKKRKMIEEEMDLEAKHNSILSYSKKTKYVPEKLKKKQRKHEKKMKSIVEYLDHFCKISDDE